MTLPNLAAAITIALASLSPIHASAADNPQPAEITAIRTLIDDDPTSQDLQRAADLVTELLRKNPDSVDGNVLAARIAIKKGYLGGRNVAPEALDLADKFVSAALMQMKFNVPAWSLKGEIELLRNRLPEAKAALDKAKSADSSNYPWLRMNLAQYYASTGEGRKAYEEYAQVVQWGPQGSPDQRRAYPQAVVKMAWYLATPDNLYTLKDLANKADRSRSRGDSWLLADLSSLFLHIGAFDDALTFGYQAVKVQNNGYERQKVANALYGKAVQATLNNADSAAFVQQAAALQTDPSQTLCAFTRAHTSVSQHLPVLKKLLPALSEQQATMVAARCGGAKQG